MTGPEKQFYCPNCRQSKLIHIRNWVAELTYLLILAPLNLPRTKERFLDVITEKLLIMLRLGILCTNFSDHDVSVSSNLVANELRQRGARIFVLKTILGFTNHFVVKTHEATFRFKGLPTASFLNSLHRGLTKDKEATKQHCRKGNFPVAQGNKFWTWQTNKAVTFGNRLGFPLVVKPRLSAEARHVNTDIRNEARLIHAIRNIQSFSSTYVIEKYIPDAFVFRATVVDFNFIGCIQQLPANIVGDGRSTIRQLIDKKNLDPRRAHTDQHFLTLSPICEDEITTTLLQEKKYNDDTILRNEEILYLQKDSFMRLGGDIVEVTPLVHPRNITLFVDLARFFDIRLTGIDFLASSITKPWNDQHCAILELNSLPSIGLHHFPSSGTPTNPARAISDMFFKYYVGE